jgi:hypothetical protein
LLEVEAIEVILADQRFWAKRHRRKRNFTDRVSLFRDFDANFPAQKLRHRVVDEENAGDRGTKQTQAPENSLSSA